jgi:hypothetical protein
LIKDGDSYLLVNAADVSADCRGRRRPVGVSSSRERWQTTKPLGTSGLGSTALLAMEARVAACSAAVAGESGGGEEGTRAEEEDGVVGA